MIDYMTQMEMPRVTFEIRHTRDPVNKSWWEGWKTSCIHLHFQNFNKQIFARLPSGAGAEREKLDFTILSPSGARLVSERIGTTLLRARTILLSVTMEGNPNYRSVFFLSPPEFKGGNHYCIDVVERQRLEASFHLVPEEARVPLEPPLSLKRKAEMWCDVQIEVVQTMAVNFEQKTIAQRHLQAVKDVVKQITEGNPELDDLYVAELRIYYKDAWEEAMESYRTLEPILFGFFVERRFETFLTLLQKMKIAVELAIALERQGDEVCPPLPSF